MTRRVVAGVVAAIATAFALAGGSAAPAAAAGNAAVSNVSVDGDGDELTFTFTALDLPPGQTLLPDPVVRINGQAVVARAEDPEANAPERGRAVMLVLDVSSEQRLDAVKEVASGVVAGSVGQPVDFGVVTFGRRPEVVQRPTRDHARATEAITRLEPAEGAALYDATLDAARLAKASSSSATVVLVTAARGDDGGPARLAAAKNALAATEVRVEVVYTGAGGATGASALSRLVGDRGRVLDAGGDEVDVTVGRVASALSNELIVTATLPPGLPRAAMLTVAAPAAGGVSTATSRRIDIPADPADAASAGVDLGAAGPRPVADSGGFAVFGDATLGIAVAVTGLGLAALLGLAFVAVGGGGGDAARVRRRLSIYTLTGRTPVKQQERTVLGDSAVARSAVDFAGRVVRSRDLESVLGRRLEAGAVPLKPAEWLLVHAGIALAAGLVALLLTGGRIVPALVALVGGTVLPWVYLSVKESRRKAAFLARMPETLQLMAGSLAAGYSLPQATDAVVREGAEPVSGEFNRALVETRLGVPIEDALDAVARRVDSRDFAWVVMAVRIQREVGGNLAELLTTVAATLRERERLRRQVKVLSAEGRLSAWILGLLPPLFAAYLIFTRPDYLTPLWTDPLGWAMIALGVLLLLVGALWLRKVVKVEV